VLISTITSGSLPAPPGIVIAIARLLVLVAVDG
jgi:hypothetical protein